MSDVKLQDIIDAGVKLTPMMKQYMEIKTSYKDCFLLFRMGDFYEVFFEDATRASALLNIALTHRGKLGDFKIPMAGIPHHSAAAYIDRLTAMGLKVAICEQVSKPGDAPGIVKRAVTQIATPGIPFDVEKLDKRENHYIGSLFKSDEKYFLTLLDFTTGDFVAHVLESKSSVLQKVHYYNPKEWISYLGQLDQDEQIQEYLEANETLVTHLSSEFFDQKLSETLCKNQLEKLIAHYDKDPFIKEYRELLVPVAAIAHYIFSTGDDLELCHIKPFKLINDSTFMRVSETTLKGLEISPKSKERYKDSLIGFCDRTKTAMGARLLKSIFSTPLMDLSEIETRQDFLSKLVSKPSELEELRSDLTQVRDIDRIMSKISTQKAIGGDLINLKNSICAYKLTTKNLKKLSLNLNETLTAKELKLLSSLEEEIENSINEEIGASLEKGNLIKDGYHKERDKLRKLRSNADNELVKLEEKYKKQTGIPKLRVKRNNVAGFFIEVSKSHTKKVPESFERRQTLVNAERYITPELQKFETKILKAKEQLEKIEREIFKDLCQKIANASAGIGKLGYYLSYVDVLCSLSWVSYQEEFSRPKILKQKQIFNSKSMWHPLIKKAIKTDFVSHNLSLNEQTFFGLITGPNMAGKTTVMREMAIVQLLAQIGCFVPAKSAELGICDHLFSRLGASDDILKGQSTFMVEMSEASEILRHATSSSMIILDEVGRGTSTYDGLSIAWSLVEHLISNTKAITLFATHYHELIQLADKKPEIKNLTVETKNYKGEIRFLYNLIEQAASQSFGLYVASLAGLPREVLDRAKCILNELEGQKEEKKISDQMRDGNQLCFFDESTNDTSYEELEQIRQTFHQIDVNLMTPIEALNKLNELKKEISLH